MREKNAVFYSRVLTNDSDDAWARDLAAKIQAMVSNQHIDVQTASVADGNRSQSIDHHLETVGGFLGLVYSSADVSVTQVVIADMAKAAARNIPALVLVETGVQLPDNTGIDLSDIVNFERDDNATAMVMVSNRVAEWQLGADDPQTKVEVEPAAAILFNFDRILGSLTHYRDADQHGWTYDLNIEPVVQGTASVLSTAYALRTLLLNPYGHDLFDAKPIVGTLLSQQVDGGGWKSKSQSYGPYALVTAPILSGLAHSHVATSAELASGIGALKLDLRRELDANRPRPTVLSSAISGLVAVDPGCDELKLAAETLRDGICQTEGCGWMYSLGEDKGNNGLKPTLDVTSRATLALAAVTQREVLDCTDVLQASSDWISSSVSPDRLDDTVEQIRDETRDGEVDVLSHGHMTSALVLRALLACGVDRGSPAVRNALDATMKRYHEGVWSVRGQSPVWASYAAVSALTLYLYSDSPVVP